MTSLDTVYNIENKTNIFHINLLNNHNIPSTTVMSPVLCLFVLNLVSCARPGYAMETVSYRLPYRIVTTTKDCLV